MEAFKRTYASWKEMQALEKFRLSPLLVGHAPVAVADVLGLARLDMLWQRESIGVSTLTAVSRLED